MHLRSLVLCLATGLAVLTPATAAHAGSVARPDAERDVVRATYDENTGKETMTPAPERTDGDIVRSAVQHRPRKVIATMKFADLTNTGGPRLHVVQVRTNEGANRSVFVETTPRSSRVTPTMITGRGRTVRCRGLDAKVDYAAKRVDVVIPRPCLSRPRWVRVGMGEAALVDDTTIFFDDANVRAGAGENLVLGPRVRR